MNRFLYLLVLAFVPALFAQKRPPVSPAAPRPLPQHVLEADLRMREQIEADWLRQAAAWNTNAVVPGAIQHFIERGARLAEDLQSRGVDVTSAQRDFQTAAAALRGNSQLTNLYFKTRWTLRRLAFSNPALDFERLLIVKRFGQETYPDVCLNHMPWVSRPGGDLCVLTWRGPDEAPLVRNLINGRLGPGHVHGMDLRWDGRRIVFGYAKTKTNAPPEGWLDRRQSYRLRRSEEPIHLFEIDADGTRLRQLTRGEWSDLDPTYAPNGDIVFCTTDTYAQEYVAYGNICDKAFVEIPREIVCKDYGHRHISAASWVRVREPHSGNKIWQGKNYRFRSPKTQLRTFLETKNYFWLSTVKRVANTVQNRLKPDSEENQTNLG